MVSAIESAYRFMSQYHTLDPLETILNSMTLGDRDMLCEGASAILQNSQTSDTKHTPNYVGILLAKTKYKKWKEKIGTKTLLGVSNTV